MNIRPLVAELFHANGRNVRTDMMKLIAALQNFVNATESAEIYSQDT
jgi:hypothetical protein